MSPYDQFKQDVIDVLWKFAKVDPVDSEKTLEKPPSGVDADISFPCFLIARKQNKHPAQLAKEISKKLKPEGLIKDIKVSDAYINFYADWNKLSALILEEVLLSGDKYGCGAKKSQKVLVEHTSANPDGPLHIGHFRNSVIGDSLAKILSFYGYNVKTEFLVNDTGRQIGIAAMEYLKHDGKPDKKPDWWVLDLYVKGNREIEKNPKLEEEVKELMRRFESGDKEVQEVYSFIVDNCLEGHKETLKRLGIKIDAFVKESKFLLSESVKRILEEIKKRVDIGRVDGERVWVDLSQFGIKREFTLTRSDGTSIYPLRDLAYHADKFSRADININVIGTDQKFYFKQLTSVLSLLYPEKTKNYTVVFYEFLLLPEGSMSTRKGKFISVDELLDRAESVAKKVVEEKMPQYSKALKDKIAKVVSVGALKYAMIKVSPEKTYAFSVEDTLKFDGDTAPYIQYTHARASSILRKSGVSFEKTPKIDGSLLTHEKERAIIRHIADFSNVVKTSAENYRPHYIANYIYKLASLFNDFYQELPVLKAEEKVKTARLVLVKAVQTVLKIGLNLLGIEAPEKM
ncbi:MAG TPA: arginine--tRNA ligase [Candidatus Desulfofervidus auxilii]|uniref:Arginine--tRNA ligase n=1 Tax=Desulfofervidus auxilii TaxID=1621989 RepID=A0A7V0NF00_DESA2|nr:arginine--tRNA ligase [Candidatus Desulfofervidus auxilii]